MKNDKLGINMKKTTGLNLFRWLILLPLSQLAFYTFFIFELWVVGKINSGIFHLDKKFVYGIMQADIINQVYSTLYTEVCFVAMVALILTFFLVRYIAPNHKNTSAILVVFFTIICFLGMYYLT